MAPPRGFEPLPLA